MHGREVRSECAPQRQLGEEIDGQLQCALDEAEEPGLQEAPVVGQLRDSPAVRQGVSPIPPSNIAAQVPGPSLTHQSNSCPYADATQSEPYWGTTQSPSREGGMSEPSDGHQTVSDPNSLTSLADLSDRVQTVTGGV